MPPSMSSSSLHLLSSKPTHPPPALSTTPLTSIAASRSPFSDCRCRLILHLHPSHLANLMDGIHAHLNTYLLTYQPPPLNSLILAYSDVRLLSTTASIFYDRPYLNFPIQLTLLTLSLPVGTAHYGRVSKVAADHVTLLVYGVFHCVISRADIPAWYEFGLLEKDGGRREEMMADSRRGVLSGWQPKSKSSLAMAAAALGGGGAGDGEEQPLSKKQAAKQKKQQEKEERRQAYLRSQQQQQPSNTTTDSSSDAATNNNDNNDNDSSNALDYAIRIGSLVRFVILSTVNHDSFISLSGSLTVDGATIVPGDVVVPAEWKAKEEADEDDRRRAEEAEATSVEKLFAAEEEADESLNETIDTAASGEVHVSKKQLKQRKKQDKANRKQAKALRKQLQQSHPPLSTTSTTTTTTTNTNSSTAVTVEQKAAVLRRREAAEEKAELEMRREQDNEVNSVVVDEGYSHVDAHVIEANDEDVNGESGQRMRGEAVKKRKRVSDEVNGMKAERREKKKKRDKNV